MKKMFLLLTIFISVNKTIQAQRIITLTADTAITTPIVVEGENLIINLNGFKLSNPTGGFLFNIKSNATVLIKNGTINPFKNWGTLDGNNSKLQWYNINHLSEGIMTKNSQFIDSVYLDGRIIKIN